MKRTLDHSLLVLLPAPSRRGRGRASFKVGFAKRDITPQAATPMWGYGARHDVLSQGVLDPLMAKAIVIEAGNDRLAIVGTRHRPRTDAGHDGTDSQGGRRKGRRANT